jgi:hypothetical protein
MTREEAHKTLVDAKLHTILEAAVDLARAFDQYDQHTRYGCVDPSPEIQMLVSIQLLGVVRESAKHIIDVYPTMKQRLDDVMDDLGDTSE